MLLIYLVNFYGKETVDKSSCIIECEDRTGHSNPFLSLFSFYLPIQLKADRNKLSTKFFDILFNDSVRPFISSAYRKS